MLGGGWFEVIELITSETHAEVHSTKAAISERQLKLFKKNQTHPKYSVSKFCSSIYLFNVHLLLDQPNNGKLDFINLS